MATIPTAMTTFSEPMMVHSTDLNPFTSNITDLYNNQLSNGYFSRYTSATSLTSTGWTVMAPTLAEGSGLGLSLGSNLFTLGAGIWEVNWFVEVAASTLIIVSLSTDTTTTSSNQIINGTYTGAGGLTSGAIGTHIRSTGSAVLAAKLFLSGATGSGAPAFLTRLTFMKEASS